MNASPDASQDNLFYLIKTVARHSAVYGLFDFIGKATALVLVPLYTHVMTTAEYGVLDYFTAVPPLLLTVLLLGFNASIVRFYTKAESPAEATGYFRTALTSVAGFSVVLWLVLMVGAPFLARKMLGNESEAGLVRLLVSAVTLDAIGAIFLALFRSQSKPYRYSWVNLARFVTILSLNVLFVGILRQGVRGVLTGNLIGSGLGAALGLVLCAKEVGFEFSRDRFRRLAAFGMPLVLSGIALSFVMSNADRFFLKASGSFQDVGIYGLGYKVGMIMSLLLNAFVVAWPPMMFRIAPEPDAPRIFSRVLTYYLLVTGFVWVLVASYSNEIVGLIAAPGFAPAGDVVWLILLSYLMQGVFYIMSVGVTITDRTGLLTVVVCVSALLNLAANALLIPRFGMMGAAWATLVSYVFLALLMRSVARRFYPILVERRRVVWLAAGCGLAVLVNRLWIGHSGIGAMVLKLVPIALLPAFLLLGRFFHEEELVRFRHMSRRVLGRRSAVD